MGNSGKGELIETLWNVNINYEERLNALERELIETLWNVNRDDTGGRSDRARINRNIVECK